MRLVRYPTGQKERTRERIVSAAAATFRRHGYAGASVDLIMKEAGLTPGGFYAHFKSKKALFVEAFARAIATAGAALPRSSEVGPEFVRAFGAAYLSASHRKMVAEGCPMPALLPDLPRAGAPAKQAFERAVAQLAGLFASHLPDREPDEALALVSLMIGGLSLSRGVADERLADRVLASCRLLIERTLFPARRKPKGD